MVDFIDYDPLSCLDNHPWISAEATLRHRSGDPVDDVHIVLPNFLKLYRE